MVENPNLSILALSSLAQMLSYQASRAYEVFIHAQMGNYQNVHYGLSFPNFVALFVICFVIFTYSIDGALF